MLKFFGGEASFENTTHFPAGRLFTESPNEAEIFESLQVGLQLSLLPNLIAVGCKVALPLIKEFGLIDNASVVAGVLILEATKCVSEQYAQKRLSEAKPGRLEELGDCLVPGRKSLCRELPQVGQAFGFVDDQLQSQPSEILLELRAVREDKIPGAAVLELDDSLQQLHCGHAPVAKLRILISHDDSSRDGR
nr:hypothetical protein [Planctomyces sp. SH-PL14]